MQILIANQDYGGHLRGDIIVVKPDIFLWGAMHVASIWLAADAVAIERGIPDRYLAPFIRTSANFPRPVAVVRYPSYRCDLNLIDPHLSGEDQPNKRLWYLNLNGDSQAGPVDIPTGQRNSISVWGGEATLGANRLAAIRNRADNTPITDVAGWEDDLTLGNTPHRHSGTGARAWSGVT